MVSPVGVATAARVPALAGCTVVTRRGRRSGWTARMGVIAAWMVAAPALQAQEPSPLARVDALALDTATLGRVTVHFAPGDGQRAAQLAELAEEAAVFFERELGLSFQFRLAVLSPGHWFSEFEDGPYTLPWYSLAHDGADLPPALRAEIPGWIRTGTGETYDFLWAPSEPGDAELVVHFPFATEPGELVLRQLLRVR
jgi:hypothetical protein